MASPTRLFLLRHGEVEERYQHVFGGRIDMELSPRGREQAALLANYLRTRNLHVIYASPMQRAQQTLAAFGPRFVQPPIVVEDLQEVDFGVWTGLNFDEVRARFNVDASEWTHKLEEGAIAGAESAASLRARIEPCLRQILESGVGQNIAVVCHGGVIRMILAILLGLPFSSTGLMAVDYASLTLVEVLPHKTRLRFLNLTPWRDLP